MKVKIEKTRNENGLAVYEVKRPVELRRAIKKIAFDAVQHGEIPMQMQSEHLVAIVQYRDGVDELYYLASDETVVVKDFLHSWRYFEECDWSVVHEWDTYCNGVRSTEKAFFYIFNFDRMKEGDYEKSEVLAFEASGRIIQGKICVTELADLNRVLERIYLNPYFVKSELTCSPLGVLE